MATAAEVNAKNQEFQAAVVELDAAQATFNEAKAPYVAATQALSDAIDKVDAIDNELEQLTKDYEPPAKP